jgi:V/A-type H+-transporting ATPase subunit I
MLARMRRIDVVTPRAVVGQTMRAIHRAGVIHLVPFESPRDIGPATFAERLDGAGDPRFEAANAFLGELAGELGTASLPKVERQNGGASPGRASSAREASTLLDELWSLDDSAMLQRIDALRPVRAAAASLTERRVSTNGDIARLDSYRELIAGLSPVLSRLPSVRGYGSTGVVIDARYRSVLGSIRAELEAMTGGRCEVVSSEIGPDRVGAVLIYPVRHAAEVRALLGGRDLEEVSLPEELVGVPFEQLGPRLAERRDRLASELHQVDAEIAVLRARHGQVIEALRLVFADRIAERRALATAGASDHLVVLSGWVPDRCIAGLRGALEREVGATVVVLDRGLSRAERSEAPVALENGPVLRAFEPLASFVVVPRYGSIDPTPLLALALPAFIGLMVGDIGYGAVLLALLLAARWRWPQAGLMRTVYPIGIVAAISTIGFGVLFGELFGDAGSALIGLRPLWLDRQEAISELLVLAIAIGVGQVGLGLVLGVVNAALLRHRRDVAGRAALLVSVVAILVALASLLRFVPAEAGVIAVAAGVIALVLLVLAVGVAGPIEVVGAIGNILSYARLMAIGLASVMLGVVANRLGGLVEGALAGILVAGVVHALNFVLGFFDASVQGIRLHYVEFFSKFVEPGGVRYDPFVSALGQPAGGVAGSAGGT